MTDQSEAVLQSLASVPVSAGCGQWFLENFYLRSCQVWFLMQESEKLHFQLVPMLVCWANLEEPG